MSTFLKVYCLSILSLFLSLGDLYGSESYSGAELIGTILDQETNEPLIGATINLINDVHQYYATTDSEGVFRIKPIESGNYKIEANYIFYKKYTIENINIGNGQTILLDLKMSEEIEIIVIDYKIPLVDPFDPSSVKIDQEIIQKAPTTKLVDIIANQVGVFQDDVGRIQIRGSRVGNVQYMVDGIKMSSINGIPMRSVSGMQVFTGGVPAKYGDTTGGVVVVTTKSFGD